MIVVKSSTTSFTFEPIKVCRILTTTPLIDLLVSGGHLVEHAKLNATRIGTNTDWAIGDLFNAIARGDAPSWTLCVQIMTPEQAKAYEFNPFDSTKLWPEDRFPNIEVGRLTLDENIQNFFAQSESAAYCPSNLVPGIEFSPDKMSHGRGFTYRMSQFHRIGNNRHLVAVNQPLEQVFNPRIRDAGMNTTDNLGGTPNYWPNSFTPNISNEARPTQVRYNMEDTDVYRFASGRDDNYTQAGEYYRGLDSDEQSRLHTNLGVDIATCYDYLQKRALEQLAKIDEGLAEGVRRVIEQTNSTTTNTSTTTK